MHFPEAALEQTDAGLRPAGSGWFVANARDLAWQRRPGRGHRLSFTGSSHEEAETLFPHLGVNLVVVEPGEPSTVYHWETDSEAFLVLSGEAILIVEGEERPLRRWDFFHCPPGTNHAFVGAGDGPCVILAIGSRQLQATGPWGKYTVHEVAIRHGAGVEEETDESSVAYARFGPPQQVSYPGGLPS